jgi:hypothetical protein
LLLVVLGLIAGLALRLDLKQAVVVVALVGRLRSTR